MQNLPDGLFSTYSIVARDPETGGFGAAVQTHQMCVGAVVPWLDPQAGVVVTQAMTNVGFGPLGIELLRGGLSAEKVTAALLATDERRQSRQLAAVDREGRVSAWTGDECIREASHHTGIGYSVQANMMTSPAVIDAMAASFESTEGDLAQRMLAALQAAQQEGGDIRGMQSAALKVVGGELVDSPGFQIPSYDLRVDEHADPLAELSRLVRLRKAQLIDSTGHRALEAGDRESATREWSTARTIAPELEEMWFWQAIAVVEECQDIRWAAEIFNAGLSPDERIDHWIDLIFRLEACGILTKEGSARALVDTIHTA